MAQKNIYKKSQQKTSQRNSTCEHYLCICLRFFLVVPGWEILVHLDIRISQSILFSLIDLCNGDTRRFMMEKPHSTPEVDGGISNANFKSFILFRKLWTEPSEHIFEYTSLYIFLFDFTFKNFLLSLFLYLII